MHQPLQPSPDRRHLHVLQSREHPLQVGVLSKYPLARHRDVWTTPPAREPNGGVTAVPAMNSARPSAVVPSKWTERYEKCYDKQGHKHQRRIQRKIMEESAVEARADVTEEGEPIEARSVQGSPVPHSLPLGHALGFSMPQSPSRPPPKVPQLGPPKVRLASSHSCGALAARLRPLRLRPVPPPAEPFFRHSTFSFHIGQKGRNGDTRIYSWALKRVWRQCHYSKHQIYTIGIMPAHRYGRY